VDSQIDLRIDESIRALTLEKEGKRERIVKVEEAEPRSAATARCAGSEKLVAERHRERRRRSTPALAPVSFAH
jgi:hypothetical protein